MLSIVGLFRLSLLPHMHRSFRWSRRHGACQSYSKLSGPRLIQLPRHWYHSGRKRSHPNEAPRNPFRTITAVTLAGLGYVVHQCSNSIPLLLETWSPISTDKDRASYKQARHVFSPPDIDQSIAILRWEEASDPIGEGSGILRTDSIRVASNSPCEDEYFSRAIGYERDDSTYANLKWMMWGVFDGHAGGETAVALRGWLVNYIISEFNEASAGLPEDSLFLADAPSSVIDESIKNAFLRLDRDIIETGRDAVLGKRYLGAAISELDACYSGSCALLSIYDRESQLLRVACVGDSRAVLGRRTSSGEWQATALSVDQTGYNSEEAARLRREHPNEPDAVKDGRVLGLAVTRAFGDALWKWSRDVQEEARDRFFGRRPPEGSLTPPYLTAEPVITTTKIQPEKGDFVIMASDGLWDSLTSAQAVDLVGRWLKTHDTTRVPKALVIDLETMRSRERERHDPEEKISYTSRPRSSPSNFVVKDTNAATHLARNALGGGDEDMLCGIMTARAPFARRIRDDITVLVIFFGHSKKDATSIQHW